MEIRGLMGGFYRACEWIVRLSYLNILWFVFTLFGLIAFGIFPATVAMFTITRKWIQGETELPVFSYFWTTFRQELISSNLLGLVLCSIGSLLIIDLYFFQRFDGLLSQTIFLVMIAIFINYLVMLLYVFPVYVHYELKLFQYIKYALIIGMSNPFHTFGLILAFIPFYFLLKLLPASILFLSVAPLSWIVMATAYRRFTKLEEKKKKEEERVREEVLN